MRHKFKNAHDFLCAASASANKPSNHVCVAVTDAPDANTLAQSLRSSAAVFHNAGRVRSQAILLHKNRKSGASFMVKCPS